jgi:prolyl-tRNA editing enzyme YbaK/EbsC (Cys-tRNA(Pro) deacylase)
VDSAAADLSHVYTGSGRVDRTLEIAMPDLLAITKARVLPLRRDD